MAGTNGAKRGGANGGGGSGAGVSAAREEKKNVVKNEAEILKSIPQTVKRGEISGFEHMSYDQLREEAKRITAIRMFNAGIIPPSVMSQLESDGYSNVLVILDTAVSRGQISKKVRNFIKDVDISYKVR